MKSLTLMISLIFFAKASEPINKEKKMNPEDVVKVLIEAMAKNDSEKIKSVFADSASQAYGDGPKKSGKDFFSWLQSDIINRKGKVKNATINSAEGGVVVKGMYTSVGYENKANFLFKLENGLIISWQMRY